MRETIYHVAVLEAGKPKREEGLWSFAKHISYNYRGVSKYHFPMYLKEVEYRCNHRKENIFKRFLESILVTFQTNNLT